MKEKQTIIFVVTNGAGLGHLTRGLAIARRLKKIQPDLEIIFLSTSLATEIIRNEGFMYYYIPTFKMMPEDVTATMWNAYLKRELEQLISFYKPKAMVYDGAYPYLGMITEINKNKKLKSIWIKRETYKSTKPSFKELEAEFNLVIIPKEAGRDYSQEERRTSEHSNRKYADPVMFLDKEEAHSRESVRKALGIGEQELLFYIQLGAGIINNIRSPLEIVKSELLKREHVHILYGESPIGRQQIKGTDKIKVIRTYPNSQYFKGVDFAVSAAGYNTYHELLYFAVPTLFIPNAKTERDDQAARAKLAEEIGAGFCIEQPTQESINTSINKLIERKKYMQFQAEVYFSQNGAEQAARWIADILVT